MVFPQFAETESFVRNAELVKKIGTSGGDGTMRKRKQLAF
jgi:hypothetical protein